MQFSLMKRIAKTIINFKSNKIMNLYELGMDELEQLYEEMAEDYESFEDFQISNGLI